MEGNGRYARTPQSLLAKETLNMGIEIYGDIGSRTKDQIVQELLSAQVVGVDTECISLEDKTMIGLSISPHTDYAVWFPTNAPQFSMAQYILRNPSVTKVFHNSKFDFDVLEKYEIDQTNFEDTMVLAYTLNLPQKLYNLVTHLGYKVDPRFSEWEFPKNTTMLDIYGHEPNFVLQKCCVDAKWTLWCWHELKSKVTRSYGIDRDIVHVLRKMEKAGVALNKDSVAEFYWSLKEDTEYLRQLISTKGCDPNSNMQVGVVLAQRGYKLPYTKSGRQLQVNEKILVDIPDPLAQAILIYREQAKLKSTYAEPLLGLDRAYTHYNNTRVVTGRLSSSNPINMQNIPDFFRSVFVADEEFWVYDANQIELRTIAYLAQDRVMMKAYADGKDLHQETMVRLGIKDRRVAKVLNFAVAYLAEEQTIMENAKKAGIVLTWQEAHEFKNRFFKIYTGMRDYIHSQREAILKYGFVTTLYGRVRQAEQWQLLDPKYKEATIRELFNMPVQGTASEIIKVAMARTQRYDLRIQVHDELVYDGLCPPKSLFEGLAPFEVPMVLKRGLNWGELEKV